MNLSMKAFSNMLFLLFGLASSLTINGPHPPKFPKTYYSLFATNISNKTEYSQNGFKYGYIAEYYEEKLAIISYGKHNRAEKLFRDKYTILFNGKLFRLNGEVCTCYDRSYGEAGFPFLASFHNYKMYYDNTTMIWWEAENFKNPFTLNNQLKSYKALLGVEADNPNVPRSFAELPPKLVDFDISFSKFQDKAFAKEKFDIPENCKELTECEK